MSYNLADLPKDDMDKVNVDLAASGVAYKERMNMPPKPLISFLKEAEFPYTHQAASAPSTLEISLASPAAKRT